MNGNFSAIQVIDENGKLAVINTEQIHSVNYGYDGRCHINTFACDIRVDATVEEVMELIREVNYVKLSSKTVGKEFIPEWEKNQSATKDELCESEPATEDEPKSEDKHGYNPTQRTIMDIAEEYDSGKYSNRFTDFNEMLSQERLEVSFRDNELADASGFMDDKFKINGNYVDILDMPESSSEDLLAHLINERKWDVIYNYVNIAPDEWCIKVWNDGTPVENQIFQNTAENIELIGLSAGDLMKSLVDGRYKKDDEYFTYECNEIVSFNSSVLYQYVYVSNITEWLSINKDKAKEYLPEEVYNDAFLKY